MKNNTMTYDELFMGELLAEIVRHHLKEVEFRWQENDVIVKTASIETTAETALKFELKVKRGDSQTLILRFNIKVLKPSVCLEIARSIQNKCDSLEIIIKTA